MQDSISVRKELWSHGQEGTAFHFITNQKQLKATLIAFSCFLLFFLAITSTLFVTMTALSAFAARYSLLY